MNQTFLMGNNNTATGNTEIKNLKDYLNAKNDVDVYYILKTFSIFWRNCYLRKDSIPITVLFFMVYFHENHF